MATLATVAHVIARDRQCFYCGEVFVTGGGVVDHSKLDMATVDHLWPESRLGSNSPANLVAACHSCNSKRGIFLPSAYAAHACCEDHARRLAADPIVRPKWLTVDEFGRLLIAESYFQEFLRRLYEETSERIEQVLAEKAKKISEMVPPSPLPSPGWETHIAKHLSVVPRRKSS